MSDTVARLFSGFDGYARAARLTPGLLMLVAPAAVVIGAGATSWPDATVLVSLLVVAGAQIPLSEWVRRRGQRLQQRLWTKWEGDPVSLALRDQGAVADRRRSALGQATGLPVGDVDHPEFDTAIRAAVRRLIDATRDKDRYGLIHEENRAYGFARNLFGIRTPALVLACLSSLVGAVLIAVATWTQYLDVAGVLPGAGVAAVCVFFWFFYPSETRVAVAAGDYRDRLLEALDGGAL